jgi:magnesium-transporting ATPase (P-type)
MGLSHLARNFDIFALADVAVGVDVLSEELNTPTDDSLRPHPENSVLPHEISFVSAISAHPCAFSLKGSTAPFKMPGIIASGRAALEAATAAGLFVIFGCVTFSLFVLFSMCAVSTTLPFVPTLGSVLYLQIVLPMIGMTMAASDADVESMERVPPKNIENVTFQRQEGKRLYRNTLFKGLLPSALPQFLFLIAFGELMIKFDPDVLVSQCGMSPEQVRDSIWTNVIRCKGLKDYSGEARTAGGALLLAEMVVCVIITSASFVHSTAPILQEPPWIRNHYWVWSCLASIGCVAIYLAVVLPNGSFGALPWYFFVISAIIPFLCLFGHEMIKRSERQLFERAVKLRRLQFETRLGMWSPK